MTLNLSNLRKIKILTIKSRGAHQAKRRKEEKT
jgi:hypothetical protein